MARTGKHPKSARAEPSANKGRGIVEQAREDFCASRHAEALAALERAAKNSPKDREVLIELGLVLCYHQREDEAVDLLERGAGAERAPELLRILKRHFHCRALMAKRLKLADAKGESLAKRVSKFAPEEPRDCGIELSACLIVKNEEKHLARCLESLKGRVDEIVVVDTGSTDSTVEIAESFGAKIGHFDWADDFSAARNESLRLATGRWALWIDADEEVDASSWGAISEGLMRPHFGGYFTRIVNILDDEGRQQYVHTPVRLFQRLPEVRFEGRIHEQVVQCFDRLGLPCATLKDVTIRHYGYRAEDMREKGKTDRTIRMLEREVQESPDDAFQWFNLANAYSVARRPEDAVNAAKRSIELMLPDHPFGSLAYQLLASGLNVTGRPEEALEASERCRERGHFTILNQYERTHSLMKLGRLQEALESADECLTMEWPEGMTGDYGIRTHKREALKGQILSDLGRLEEAHEVLSRALSVDPHFGLALYAMGVNLQRMGRFEEALATMSGAFADVDFAYPALKAAANVCRSLSKGSEAAQLDERAWRLNPSDGSCWVAWAKFAEDSGDANEMIRAYEALASVAEPNADVYVNWGRALDSLGDPMGALEKLTLAIQLDPANANAMFNAGDLLYRIGRFEEAADLYQAALRLNPVNAEGWFVLGNALAQMDALDAARVAYRQALTQSPEHNGAKHNLALISNERPAAA